MTFPYDHTLFIYYANSGIILEYFWNNSGIGYSTYSGIIPELAILELFPNWLFWNYSGIITE
jgi:hypothetical protein